MRIVVWLTRAFLFFVLFAFALNNGEPATVRWFFGYEWRTSMIFVVLAAFALGCAAGVLAMLPSWWRHRRVAQRRTEPGGRELPSDTSQLVAPSAPEFPPRDGI